MHPLTPEAVSLLKEMISIPSHSFEEENVCKHICEYLERCGIEVQRSGNNIICYNKNFSKAKKTLMLNAHIDTVPPCNGYTFDPYVPQYNMSRSHCYNKNEVIYGLGSNDDGGSVVSMITAFRHFYNRDMHINLMLVLTAEEERSGKGGMELVWKNLPQKPDWAIIGEPTGMEAATSERGLLVIDAKAEGVSGHAARNEGTNALYIATDDISVLRNHKFSRTSEIMGDVNMNVTQIHAGSSHNIIPDICTFTIDIRPTEKYDNAELLTELQSLCHSRLTARNLKNRSSATPKNSLLLKCIKALDIHEYSSPTTSDWMRTDCEAIKIGPGDSSRSHRKDEFIFAYEIDKAIGIYIELTEKLAIMAKTTE